MKHVCKFHFSVVRYTVKSESSRFLLTNQSQNSSTDSMDLQRRNGRAADWARFRATVATLAATGIVLVCLSYRDQESNRLGNVPRNGAFFAGLAPSDDTIDSPNGQRGFQLLQKGTPASVSLVSGTQSAAIAKGGSRGVVVADGLRFKARAHTVDFLSAGAARNQMKLYWQGLAHKTSLESNGEPRGGHRERPRVAEADAPLTAGEARRQLEDYWDDLGSHDHVRSVRTVQRKIEAAARLSKRAKKVVDVVKDTSMDEMERIWSSEGKGAKAGTPLTVAKPAAKTKDAVAKVHAPSTRQGHQLAAAKAPAAPDASPAVNDEAMLGAGTPIYTSLPMCDHCSQQHFTWPVWNHRVDHALRVAENIAQGSHWNTTLHHVTVPAPDASDDGDDAESADMPTDTSDADLELEVESAMSTLRAAIAESKAEQVEQEAQEHGADSTSLATAQRTQCLDVCYNEVQSLVGFLASEKHVHSAGSSLTTRQKPAARGTVAAVSTSPGSRAVKVIHHRKLAGSNGAPAVSAPALASPKSDTSLDDGDSIEKAVDAVEEAVGDSEADAGKSGGSGVAAAVGAVEAAVAKDVDEAPAGASSAGKQRAARWAGVTAGARGSVPKAGEQSMPVARTTASKVATGAGDGHDVRKLEDSALNDAAEAQEQVRQGESELKHLKTLLARAHKLDRHAQASASSSPGDVATSAAASDTNDADADFESSADDGSGLAAALSSSQALALAKARSPSKSVQDH